MSYGKKFLPISNAHSNFTPTRDQESPDLLERCQTVFSDSELPNYSSGNLTDIVISDDDDNVNDNDRNSINSDVTVVLEPDIIIDYVRTRTPPKQNTSEICNSSTKTRQDITMKECFIRCKPLDMLLAKNNASPVTVKNSKDSHISDRIDHGKTNSTNKNTRKIFKNNQELIEKLNTENSDSSSSSSVVPPTPSPKRLKKRRIVVLTDSDASNSSERTLSSTSIAELNQPSKPTSPVNECRKLQVNGYHRLMKEWSMREATPPTSDSDSNDHNFERRKTRSSIAIKKTQNYKLNTRSAKSNARSRIKQVLIEEKIAKNDSSDNDADDDDDDDYDDNNMKQTDKSESSDNVYSNHKREMKFCWEWMSKYGYIENKIRKNYSIPVGKTFYKWEQIGIWWLIKTENISNANTRRIWSEMIDEGYLRHRTKRSLANHFTRIIQPNLHKFSLPKEVIAKFNKNSLTKKR